MPYGYEPQLESVKGTLLALGIFDNPQEDKVPQLAELAAERSFARLVLIPQHDETLRRMKLKSEHAYYERVDGLERWIAEADPALPVSVDAWEGKRKKYTPLDSLLDFATEKYKAPHFVAMSQAYADLFASYSSFDEWIRRVRLLVMTRPGYEAPAKLAANGHRWEAVYL
jgi:nicotinic acid mononucleotide adenylyltransferase